MNQELSTTEAKQVEQAGEAFSRNHNFAQDRTLLEDGFEAGVDYALKELLPARCVGFAEYVRENYAAAGINLWEDEFGNPFTTVQLCQKYITDYLKQQQDGRASKEGI